MDPTHVDGIDELEHRITTRSTLVGNQALRQRPRWTAEIAGSPDRPEGRWTDNVRAVAAYRDPYDITTDDPIGPRPRGTGDRLRAWATAQRHTTTGATRQRTSAPERAPAVRADHGRGHGPEM